MMVCCVQNLKGEKNEFHLFWHKGVTSKNVGEEKKWSAVNAFQMHFVILVIDFIAEPVSFLAFAVFFSHWILSQI